MFQEITKTMDECNVKTQRSTVEWSLQSLVHLCKLSKLNHVRATFIILPILLSVIMGSYKHLNLIYWCKEKDGHPGMDTMNEN